MPRFGGFLQSFVHDAERVPALRKLRRGCDGRLDPARGLCIIGCIESLHRLSERPLSAKGMLLSETLIAEGSPADWLRTSGGKVVLVRVVSRLEISTVVKV